MQNLGIMRKEQALIHNNQQLLEKYEEYFAIDTYDILQPKPSMSLGTEFSDSSSHWKPNLADAVRESLRFNP